MASPPQLTSTSSLACAKAPPGAAAKACRPAPAPRTARTGGARSRRARTDRPAISSGLFLEFVRHVSSPFLLVVGSLVGIAAFAEAGSPVPPAMSARPHCRRAMRPRRYRRHGNAELRAAARRQLEPGRSAEIGRGRRRRGDRHCRPAGPRALIVMCSGRTASKASPADALGGRAPMTRGPRRGQSRHRRPAGRPSAAAC